MSFEMASASYFPGSKWYTPGRHSFGYNQLLGADRRLPNGDTIILMDYLKWSVAETDSAAENLAPRHGGKLNVFFAGGYCKAMYPEELTTTKDGVLKIRRGLLTPASGD